MPVEQDFRRNRVSGEEKLKCRTLRLFVQFLTLPNFPNSQPRPFLGPFSDTRQLILFDKSERPQPEIYLSLLETLILAQFGGQNDPAGRHGGSTDSCRLQVPETFLVHHPIYHLL